MKYITLFAIILLVSQVQSRRVGWNNLEEENIQVDSTARKAITGWFDKQIINHFKPQPIQYWSQRYFIQNQYYDYKKGPLILYIGGEGEAYPAGGFTLKIAKQFKGIVATLEHRFYGESQPFGKNENSYSIENLKFLTHEQALEDLANFIGYLKDSGKYGIHQNTPIITVGGSYPGALSAWFRYKYPHLTIGSLASSAVVNAIEDYQDFDMQVRLSTESQGYQCPEAIQNLTKYAMEQVANNQTAVAFKTKFGAQQLVNNNDFLYFFADIFALRVQYSKTTQVCNQWLKGKTQEQQLEIIQKFARDSCDPDDYDREKLKLTGYQSTAGNNIRQWTYQTCTYFGWFYDAAKFQPLRAPSIDLDYFLDLCQTAYGARYMPEVPMTNLVMGAKDMLVNNIIFTNGGQDPWKWASIRKDIPPMKSYVVDCVDCGHCIDLGSDRPGQPEILTQTRQNILNTMEIWIGEYWNSQQQQDEL